MQTQAFRTTTRLKDPALEDKLFFTKLPFFQELGLLADIGAGPAQHVAKAVHNLRPDIGIIVVDPSLAAHPGDSENTWGGFLQDATRDGKGLPSRSGRQRALLFSSSIHEMFSPEGHYGEPSPARFWLDVKETGTEYVILRDMAFTSSPDFVLRPDICHNMMDLHAKTIRGGVEHGLPPHIANARTLRMLSHLAEVDGQPHGVSSVIMREHMDHTLKFMHGADRWLDEMEEFYFALDPKAFDYAATLAGYTPIHFETYALPFLKDHEEIGKLWKPQDDSVMQGTFTTHIKAVYKRDA